MIKNKIMNYNVLNTLRKNVWLNTDELAEIQMKYLNRVLHDAYSNSPYYRDLFKVSGIMPDDIKNYDDLIKIPITSKEQLKKYRDNIISKKVNLKACNVHKTSGSTGKPLSLLYDKECSQYTRASYSRARVENGYRPHKDVFLDVTSSSFLPKNKTWYQNLMGHNNYRLSVFEPLDIQMGILKDIKPNVIWGYPSAIKILASAVIENGLGDLSPRLIFTASEVLDSDTRNLINSAFNVSLFDVYGSWETGCMAWECDEHSGYHMSMDTVLMEFVDENGEHVGEGEKGKIIVTNLHSFAMPIIRYEVGDIAVSKGGHCSCGRGGYLLEKIEGRCDDFIRTPSDKMISPTGFWVIMRSLKDVSEFKIVQRKIDQIDVFVVIYDGVNESVLFDKIFSKFTELIGDSIDVKLFVVDKIPKEKSGKFRSVVSEI